MSSLTSSACYSSRIYLRLRGIKARNVPLQVLRQSAVAETAHDPQRSRALSQIGLRVHQRDHGMSKPEAILSSSITVG